MDAHAADMVTDYLTSWENVALFFKEFQHCYDGGVAASAQDKIHLLWAERWRELPKMIALTRSDPEFKAFLLRVLASEAFSQDTFAKVVRNASRQCPRTAKEFCQAVKKAAAVNHGV
jgi:hypothetical protein